MFCKQCGNELIGTEAYCDACGEPIQAGRVEDRAIAQGDDTSKGDVRAHNEGNAYQSFEYARMTVKSDLAQVACDCYESLGYELTGQKMTRPGDEVTLSFRRSRKVRGKAQLSKMQHAMDNMLASISNLEAKKGQSASMQALAIGVVSALVFGIGMCFTMLWTHLMVPGVVIGAIGIAGCIYAWFRYRKAYEKAAAHIDPQIESVYDRLATQCEEAQAVLRASE